MPRRWISIGVIGCLAVAPQPASGQSPSGARSWIDPADERYQERFEVLLLDEPTRDLARGWSYAKELGRPVSPMLWAMLDAERSNVDRRLALLVAALVAGGPASDARLFRMLDLPKPLLAERAMASLWIALGPQRQRPVEGALSSLLGPNTEPEDLLAVAARLAVARFPAPSKPAAAVRSKDPGLLASAAFSRSPVGRTSAQRQWRAGSRHAGLFRRAAMLGALRSEDAAGVGQQLKDRASAALRDGDARDRGERAAAALLLARFGELAVDRAPLGWELLKLAVSQPASAAALRGQLRPSRFARDPEPGRLAAAYALYAPLAEVLAAAAEWSRDQVVRRHLALALALRLCTLDAPPPIETELDFPEWSLVVWASGGTPQPAAPFEDERLAALAEVLAAGRASKESVRAELELVLWRLGSHPGIGPWELERQLVRDLLLVGSRAGGKYRPEVPLHQRYFPTGLDREDPFFDVAVALYEFAGRRTGPVPAQLRLR